MHIPLCLSEVAQKSNNTEPVVDFLFRGGSGQVGNRSWGCVENEEEDSHRYGDSKDEDAGKEADRCM